MKKKFEWKDEPEEEPHERRQWRENQREFLSVIYSNSIQ
jgi:hypothetical protein